LAPDPVQPFPDAAAVRFGDRKIVDTPDERVGIDELVRERFASKIPVPLTPGYAFREHQVVWL
jgi:hypothetical protein